MLIGASLWPEDLIRSDVWIAAPDLPDPEVESGLVSNYYFKPMNFSPSSVFIFKIS